MIKYRPTLLVLFCLLTSTIVFGHAKLRPGVSKAALETRSIVVMAGGTVVVETATPGTKSMPTVYYLDGNDLVLIHYCAGASHMHAHTIVFLDRERTRSERKDCTNGCDDATDIVSMSRVR